jgi:hypothetical protein
MFMREGEKKGTRNNDSEELETDRFIRNSFYELSSSSGEDCVNGELHKQIAQTHNNVGFLNLLTY